MQVLIEKESTRRKNKNDALLHVHMEESESKVERISAEEAEKEQAKFRGESQEGKQQTDRQLYQCLREV